jgi:SAM-dependent methyltransferase
VLTYGGMTTDGTPLRLGTPAQFEEVRRALERADFTERGICERLGIPAFTHFGVGRPGRPWTDALATPLAALIRLFLQCEAAPLAVIEPLLGKTAIDAMRELGLLASDSDPSQVASPVGLCPTRGLYLVSDRGGDLASLPEDVVYPAILENTRNFLDIIPTNPCEAFLDLGTGTGVAALLAGRDFAREVWACDITARSVQFAEFNRRLNGLENVTVAQGDLYDPAGGRLFDRIVSHPPYVPVSQPTCIFRDGGDDGELIIRRIVEGLPKHLAPGGRFYALTLVSDREGQPAEQRVREWLGAAGSGFDIALIAETAREPFDFIGRAMQKGTHRVDELEYWNNVFRAVKVKFLVYGCILVQRHATERESFTVRLQKGSDSGPAETDWALRWHTEAASPGWQERILQSPIGLSPELNLAVLHKVGEGSLTPVEYLLRVRHPFESECKCPAWVAGLLAECDGRRTAIDVLNSLKEKRVVDSDTEPAEFAEVLRVLVGSGFLELPSHRFPAISTQPG